MLRKLGYTYLYFNEGIGVVCESHNCCSEVHAVYFIRILACRLYIPRLMVAT
jgi:hypothetical protein